MAGFDAEPKMIRYANDHGNASHRRRAWFFGARMEDFDRVVPKRGEWSRFGFAYNLINTIRHLGSDRAMLDHFAAVARVLRPGGVYAVGISLSLYGVEQETEDVWEGTRGRCRVSQVVQYLPPEGAGGSGRARGGTREERVISHLTVTRPRGEEHRDSAYVLRTYDIAQWTGLISRSALRTVVVLGDDGVEIAPPKLGYAIWVLEKR